MGMQADLKLSDTQFFNCLMMFCMLSSLDLGRYLTTTNIDPVVGYMVFMLPANLAMRVVGPPHQLGVAVAFFGVCGACLAAAKNYGTVLGLRVLIGIGEAFVQVGLLYFSFWYKRNEVATRAGEFQPARCCLEYSSNAA
jgi:MFS family permease